MEKKSVKILRNTEIKPGVFQMELMAPGIARTARPGQFLNMYTGSDAMLLPRALSIADVVGDIVVLLYALVGAGTRTFAGMKRGMSIDVLGPLGTGFDLGSAANVSSVLLVGGGLGIAPLAFAARQLRKSGERLRIIAVLGYGDAEFFGEHISCHADDFYPISERDESVAPDGMTGNVLDMLELLWGEEKPEDRLMLACGPMPMLRALAAWTQERSVPLHISLEERMGCGYGACVGCSVMTREGPKKVCKDGPVFDAREIVWQ